MDINSLNNDLLKNLVNGIYLNLYNSIDCLMTLVLLFAKYVSYVIIVAYLRIDVYEVLPLVERRVLEYLSAE